MKQHLCNVEISEGLFSNESTIKIKTCDNLTFSSFVESDLVDPVTSTLKVNLIDRDSCNAIISFPSSYGKVVLRVPASILVVD